MESWERREVPLHVVLRGIEKVFDNQDAKSGRRRTIKGLSYCREEIEAQYEEWLERQIGKNASEPETEIAGENSLFTDDSIRAHLSRVSAELQIAREKSAGELREILERISMRLGVIENEYTDAETLENSLSDLEKLIDETLLETVDKPTLEEITAQITKNLASYKNKMEHEIYQRTFDLMLLKELRERRQIPRLSLFYL